MTFSNSLADKSGSLVLDTSVLINLHASGFGERILRALPHEILIPDMVASELNHPTGHKNGEAAFVGRLLSSGTGRSVPLSDEEFALFENIVAGARSLGDGEAASIALAVQNKHIVALDDRKGRDQARTALSTISLCWSLDLFLHPDVQTSLGTTAVGDAIFSALQVGRMRIHDSHCDHAVALIGVERALHCPSLPGFKLKRDIWRRQCDDNTSTALRHL